jgi:hypothetical protein
MTDMTGGKGLIDKQVGRLASKAEHACACACACACPCGPCHHALFTPLRPLQTSVAGMLSVLEDGAAGKLELAGTFHDYKRATIPW